MREHHRLPHREREKYGRVLETMKEKEFRAYEIRWSTHSRMMMPWTGREVDQESRHWKRDTNIVMDG
jgi:hypothetical protein